MNFITRTFSLVGQSFWLFIKKPWLLLYGIIPSLIARYIEFSQFKAMISPEQQKLLPQFIPLITLPILPYQLNFLLFKALPFLIGVALFICHLISTLDPKDSSLRKTYHCKPKMLLGLAVLLLIEGGIALLTMHSLKILLTSSSTAHMILHNLLLFVWATIYYLLITIIVVEQVSLPRAAVLLWRLVKDCWMHIILGTFLIGFVIALIKLTCNFFDITDAQYPYLIPAFFAGLSLIKYAFAVLLYRWHAHHYAVATQNGKR